MKSPISSKREQVCKVDSASSMRLSSTLQPKVITLQFMLFLCSFLTIPISTAQAEPNKSFQNYTVGGQVIKLLTPDSYCLLDISNPADKMALTSLSKSLEGRNDVIAQFGNCSELEKWRGGKVQTFDHKGSYQVSSKLKSVDLTGKEQETVHNICGFLASKGEPYNENIKKFSQGFQSIAPNQGKRLGIIHEENNLCIAASVLTSEQLDAQSSDPQNKSQPTPTTQISLYATSIIKGRLIYSYLYAPGKNIDDLNLLNKQIIEHHQLNQAANK